MSKTEGNYKVINKNQTTLEKTEAQRKETEERKGMKPEGGECDRRQNRQSTRRESVLSEEGQERPKRSARADSLRPVRPNFLKHRRLRVLECS